MENKATTLENLFENVEQYSKTSFELYKHKAVYEISVLSSSLALRFILTIVAALVSLFISMGFAIWFGDLLGNSYSGYFVVGSFYLILGLALIFFGKSWIKTQISNLVIKSMLSQK